jgi:Ca2+-transporting ATPase
MSSPHTWTAEETLKQFATTFEGLGPEQVASSQERYGKNVLAEAKRDSLVAIFARQFQSPLIYILLVASIIIFLIKEVADAAIILFVLLFNAVVGTIQEGRAQNTLASLKKFTQTNATVVRGDIEEIVQDTEVVVGDIVVLREGDKVPADVRIITSTGLTVDEAALTGESQPVYKTIEALKVEKLSVPEQKNMAFKGTNVMSGSGRAVVTAVGVATVIGAISANIAGLESEDPLKRDVRKLSRLIITVVVAVSAALFAIGVATGKPVTEMFATVVSLSVSIIPEGLPIVLTLVLATGVWRMSKKNALVKKLQAVESLGQATVIAVDKTGTITKNELVVTKAYVDGQVFTVSGSGYEPTGIVDLGGTPVAPPKQAGLMRLGEIAAFCSSAHAYFSEEKQTWQVMGDPTEAALRVLSSKLDLHKTALEAQAPQLAEIPFSYQNKYHAVLHRTGSDPTLSVVGAPEVVLERASTVWHGQKTVALTDASRAALERQVADLSKQGLRVLALGYKVVRAEALVPDDVRDIVFVGLVGMKDTLRTEVHEALRRAHEAGMRVVMITGDHKLTAEAIAVEAGIFIPGSRVLTGAEINELTLAELKAKLADVTVFARVTPEHKLRIIQAYRAAGEIIAMTGDGVNDAPPLVAADLGVAMGKIGTEVAKEAADIVLLDDNFGSIVSAVEEGRSIYKTIKKVILYLFSTSLGEVLTIAGALLLGLPLPILAAQIIWLNFVTDGFLDVSLAMEPKEHGLLHKDYDRSRTTALVDGKMGQRMLYMALPMAIGTLWLFSYYMQDLTKGWTMSLTLLAAFQWFNAWNCRSEEKSLFTQNPFTNKYLLGATTIVVLLHFLAVYHPFMQRFLNTTSLSGYEWLQVVLIATSIVVVEELRKFIHRRTAFSGVPA